MDKIVGGSTPSSTKSGKGGNNSLRAVGRYDENCDAFRKNTLTASNVVHPVVTPNSHPCAENRDASLNTPSNRARDLYVALTPEQKDDRNKKARERRKRKKEETQCQLEVNDSNPLRQGKSEASHLNITPRRLPFTIINNVAHYGPNEVPMSCVTQTTTLNMNTSDFVVHNSGNDQNECDHNDDISLGNTNLTS
uniref:Uncharacterized protein n=1 Tax=Oryza meridionalis TaxID=40149 RepID=A0A0E0EPY7_9ORYZ